MLRRYVLAAACLGAAACSQELEIPADAQIACGPAGECPNGYTCYAALDRCVRASGDLQPPGIVDGVVDIPVRLGTRGSELDISFEVDRALAADPQVVASWGGGAPGSRDCTLRSKDEATRRYTYVYRVGEAEPETAVSITIDLLSTDRVPARFELTRAIELDFQAPSVAAGTTSREVTPVAGSLVRSPRQAGDGALVTLRFAVTETLSELSVTTSPGEHALDCGAPLGTFYTCTLVTDTPADGAYDLIASLRDVAGNTADVPLFPSARLVIDRAAPAAPDTSVGRIIYHRAPHGSDADGAVSYFSVRGNGGAVEPSATVVFFDGPDVATSAELGRGSADSAGAFAEVALVRADRPRVYVVALDAAGNPSDADVAAAGVQATLVRDVEWVAALGGKIAGSRFENPHVVRERSWFGPALQQAGARELDDAGRMVAADGAGLRAEGGGSWARVDHFTLAPAGAQQPTVFDTWRGVTVLLEPNPLSVHHWNGFAWSEQPALDPEGDGSPAYLEEGTAAFDSRRGELVVYVPSNPAETWLWNGTSWRKAAGPSPSRRSQMALVFDPGRGVVLLFGGELPAYPYTRSDETWAWDGSSWTLLELTGPRARSRHAMTYDSQRGVVVLTGGEGDGTCPSESACGCFLTDTWELDAEGWSMRCDGLTADCGNEPTVGSGHRLAFDERRGVSVLWGGTVCAYDQGSMPAQVWEWDGTSWTSPAATDPEADGNPGGRMAHSLFYDPHTERVVLVGGENEFEDYTSALYAGCIQWTWDGASWARQIDGLEAGVDCSRPRPQSFLYASLAYDASRRSLVFFTGDAGRTTWELRAGAWTATSTGTGPSARYRYTATTSATGTQLFGGYVLYSSNTLGDSWNRAGTTWTQVSTTGPQKRVDAAMTYDPVSSVVYLYGGSDNLGTGVPCNDGTGTTNYCYLADLWGYGVWGTPTCSSAGVRCWRRLPDAPQRAYNASLAYAGNGNLLLFGGADHASTHGATHLWNGSTWSTPTTSVAPSPRRASASAFDTRRQKVVLVAGGSTQCSNGACSDVWEWDGSTWRERAIADLEGDGSLRARAQATGSWAEHEGALYVAGGNSGDDYSKPVSYRWDGGAKAKPGHEIEIDFSSAGAGADATLERVDVAVRAAGRGYEASTPRGGYALRIWRDGRWVEVERLEASTGAAGDLGSPADLSWCATPTGSATCDAVDDLRSLLVGRGQALHAAAVTAFASGHGVAEIETDYVEVVVRYREGP